MRTSTRSARAPRVRYKEFQGATHSVALVDGCHATNFWGDEALPSRCTAEPHAILPNLVTRWTPLHTSSVPGGGALQWPIFKWAGGKEDIYFARLSKNAISIYQVRHLHVLLWVIVIPPSMLPSSQQP